MWILDKWLIFFFCMNYLKNIQGILNLKCIISQLKFEFNWVSYVLTVNFTFQICIENNIKSLSKKESLFKA